MPEPLRVNVGCGPDVVPGWTNVDRSPSALLSERPLVRRLLRKLNVIGEEQATGLPAGIIRADASKHLPFQTGTIAVVYSGHMIEHMSRWQGLAFIRECHRILRPGGTLRISSPDLRLLVRSYLDGEVRYDSAPTPADSLMMELGTYCEAPEPRARRFVRRHLSGAAHQWLYDADSLEALFREVGFDEITVRGYLESRIEDVASVEKRPRSVFVEAVR